MKITLPAFPVEGLCQCGAVRYRIGVSPLSVYNCHCRDCRKLSGATPGRRRPWASLPATHPGR